MTVQVLDGQRVVAAHERAAGKYAEVLVLDHYLEVLKYKPGALPGATALAQARAAGAFTASHQRYWDAARQGRGDAAGTRSLIEVLLAHRTGPCPPPRSPQRWTRPSTAAHWTRKRYSSMPGGWPVARSRRSFQSAR